mmetsp:Transcript_25612/g.84319  ORF Transcript_25612/g.84319 Transcript_25612/m.84319 type:complete len:370 (+) Transcript_25612:779-1888(+)
MRHRLPSKSTPEISKKELSSSIRGSGHGSPSLGSIRLRCSTTMNAIAATYCAPSVASAAPWRPRLSPVGSTITKSPIRLKRPATRKMPSGVRASCCPRQPPCAHVHTSTAGMASARMRRYTSDWSRSAPCTPMAPSSDTPNVSSVADATMPHPAAMTTAFASVRFMADMSRSEPARATIPVVAIPRKVKSWKTTLKSAVFGPSAASSRLPNRPTHDVSIRDMSGSASRLPSAGSASVLISRSSSAPSRRSFARPSLPRVPLMSRSTLPFGLPLLVSKDEMRDDDVEDEGIDDDAEAEEDVEARSGDDDASSSSSPGARTGRVDDANEGGCCSFASVSTPGTGRPALVSHGGGSVAESLLLAPAAARSSS